MFMLITIIVCGCKSIGLKDVKFKMGYAYECLEIIQMDVK